LRVHEAHRNKGIGRKLHDYLRGGRSEAFTAMTVIIDNEPAAVPTCGGIQDYWADSARAREPAV